MRGLVADIGGTNARFALWEVGRGVTASRTLPTADFASPAAAAEQFLAELPADKRPKRGAMAVACPVLGDAIELTNAHWSFSIEAVREQLGFDSLKVVNDFAGVALSLPHLSVDDRRQVGAGVSERGYPLAVLGPGTGLGSAGIVPTDYGWVPLPGEGGHVTLAASNDREAEVLARMRATYGHVSVERVVSGPGLVNLHAALTQLAGEAPAELTPAEITAGAIERGDPICREAVDLMCAFLGTAAADVALLLGARGGVYIAGGIVPRLGDTFDASPFRRRFEAKGRFSDYLSEIPTYVITHETPAFVGLGWLLGTGGG